MLETVMSCLLYRWISGGVNLLGSRGIECGCAKKNMGNLGKTFTDIQWTTDPESEYFPVQHE
jgi:hypothetical protein